MKLDTLEDYEEICMFAYSRLDIFIELRDKYSPANKFFVDCYSSIIEYFDPKIMFEYKLGFGSIEDICRITDNCIFYHALFCYGIINKVDKYEFGTKKYFDIVNNSAIKLFNLTNKQLKDRFTV